MKYKGYKIYINFQRTVFYELSKDGEFQTDKPVEGVQYTSLDDEGWYSVVGEDGWVEQSFETIEECKEYIREQQ